MKSFLQSDWGPLLRQAARTIGHALALVWTLAVIGWDALMLMNDELATWWVAALGVTPAPVAVAAPVAPPPAPAPNSWGLKPDALAEREHSNLRAVAAPVAPPPAPAKPPRKAAAVAVAPAKPRPARRRKAKAVPALAPVLMGA